MYLTRPRIGGRLGGRFAQVTPLMKSFSALSIRRANTGSIFGQVTETDPKASSMLDQMTPSAESQKKEDENSSAVPSGPKSDRVLRNDPDVRNLMHPQPKTAPELLLSPLKLRLYQLALEKYGKYVPDATVKLDGKEYQLSLSKQEQQALEPNVYLRSYRIKSSPKKATPFLRMLRGMKLKEAITQCHFSAKHISRDVGDMLTRGIKEAQALGLDPDNVYLAQIWVGKDGGNIKRIDFKGRGKMGIIEHKWVHVRAILKPLEAKDQFENKQKKQKQSRKVWTQLESRPIHDFPRGSEYKW
uniref:ARAD1C11044p n=1 Tax=Blastobotrys adeninivorans TaxID=409370 RepID=A0A060T5C7_BLAAD